MSYASAAMTARARLRLAAGRRWARGAALRTGSVSSGELNGRAFSRLRVGDDRDIVRPGVNPVVRCGIERHAREAFPFGCTI